MATIARIPVTWTGGTGGAGVSTFYSDATGTIPTGALNTFFTALKSFIPSNITWTIPSSGDVFSDSSGALVSSWSLGTPATIACTGSPSSYAGASGVVIRWNTAGIANNRRVRGRTFFVPVVAAIYDSGSIVGSQLASFQTAANALVASAGTDLRIWHRPVAGAGGSSHAITSALAPDLAAVLRSRRD